MQAGIVVVVAAGNTGRASDGRAMLGGISSPGNSPYAITVGALNTWGTVDRSDDTVATFSSRGPSAYDLAVKPDIAAPGTKILSLQADGAFLPAMYPSIHVAGSGSNAYMYLSGTSMAAPMVSGGVALLLQGSPNLSPAQVKFALQNGATAMTDGGLMGAGAGSVNFWASRQIAVYGASPASAQTAPSLGAAQSFAVLGGSTVTNTGASVITGDLGVSPGTAVTGFPPGLVMSGTIHGADAAALAAQDAVTTAYNSLVGQACTQDLTGQDLGGQTLTAGVYCFSSSAQLTGTLTLNAQGNANAVFIFKMGSTLTTASASSVVLTNGGSAGNVFWQVGSSATLGTTTSFAGNILALTSITVTTGARVTGRTLARNGAVTLDTNAVTATNQLTSAVTTTVGGAQTTGSGVSFWDTGTLAARLEAGIGTRVLSAADASLAWANPSLLTFGDLNLLGLTNPLAALAPKSLLWGEVASWTSANQIIWGDHNLQPAGRADHLGRRHDHRSRRASRSSGAARCSRRPTPTDTMTSPSAGAREPGSRDHQPRCACTSGSSVAIGGIAVVHSIAALPRAPHPLEWAAFAFLALVAGSFTIKIASIEATMSASDTFVITSALLFGPAPATVALALDSLVMSWRRGHGWTRLAFNAVAPSLSLWVGAHVFFLIAGVAPLSEGQASAGALVVPLFCLTIIYFAPEFRADRDRRRARSGQSPVDDLAAALSMALARISARRLRLHSVSFC